MSNLPPTPVPYEIDTTNRKYGLRQRGPDETYSKQTLLWWPQADTGKLRNAAKAWDDLGSKLDYVADQLDRQVAFLTTSWSGDAQAQFSQMWAQWTSPKPMTFPAAPSAKPGGRSPQNKGPVVQKGHLRQTADNCRTLGKALSDYADQVDQYRQKLLAMIAGTAVAIVAGVALTVVTAGASDAAAVEAGAGLSVAASNLGIQMSADTALFLGRLGVTVYYGFLAGVVTDVAGHITYNEVLNPLSDPLAGITVQEMVFAGVSWVATEGLFKALSLATSSAGLPGSENPWGIHPGESPADFGTRAASEWKALGGSSVYSQYDFIAANVNVSNLTQEQAVVAVGQYANALGDRFVPGKLGNDMVLTPVKPAPINTGPLIIVRPDGTVIRATGNYTFDSMGDPIFTNVTEDPAPLVP